MYSAKNEKLFGKHREAIGERMHATAFKQAQHTVKLAQVACKVVCELGAGDKVQWKWPGGCLGHRTVEDILQSEELFSKESPAENTATRSLRVVWEDVETPVVETKAIREVEKALEEVKREN